MKRILLALFTVSLLASCVTQSACDKKFPPTTSKKDSTVIHDSVVVKIKDSVNIVTKDSTVIVEKVSGKDSIPCNENSKQTIRRGKDVFNISVKNGKVYFDYNLEGTVSHYNSIIQYQAHAIDSMSNLSVTHVQETTIVKAPPALPWWKAWLIKIWDVLELILALLGAFCVIRFVVKLVIKTYFP